MWAKKSSGVAYISVSGAGECNGSGTLAYFAFNQLESKDLEMHISNWINLRFNICTVYFFEEQHCISPMVCFTK